jgi:cytochrome b561
MAVPSAAVPARVALRSRIAYSRLMTVDLQPSFGLAVTVGLILASVAVWAFFWWLSGRAKTGVRRRIRVVLVLAGVLYVALYLNTFLVPIHTGRP